MPAPPPAPDRYADAVRARRAELRAAIALLDAGHRADLHRCLALSRLSASSDAAAALTGLAREARSRVRDGDRAARALLPAQLAAATAALLPALHVRWAEQLAPALRRLATERGLDPAVVPPPPRPAPPPPPPSPPQPVGLVRAAFAGPGAGAALWRAAALPLAVVPLPVLGGPALVPLAAGAAVAAVVLAACARRTAAERSGLLAHVEELLAAARAAHDADLARRLLQVEGAVGERLAAAVGERRAALAAELALLAPDAEHGAPAVRGGAR